jgi:bis(5'-nucleosidyl)-tetraphosphatase
MRLDQSYGVVPLQKVGSSWRIFLVRHLSGHWTLPKGHPELNELPLESAKRELFEETGLVIETLLFDEPLIERYQFSSRGTQIDKTVDYYIATVSGKVKIQIEEIIEGKWIDLKEAQHFVTYAQMKSLLHTVAMLLKKKLPEE